MARERLWLYDNVKALLMLLVVLGHMFTDYVGDSYTIRMVTLWIYTFHMPAFVFVSGLLHKRNAIDSKLRWDKVIGFVLVGLALRYFNFFVRILMGQHPHPHIIYEAGIPWYLFVMAEYEVFFYLIRKLDGKKVVALSIAASMLCGYFPFINDNFCLARFVNFMPFYAVGYYLEPKAVADWAAKPKIRIFSVIVFIGTFAGSLMAPWNWYRLRKCFTGRRSYEFLADLFGGGHVYELGWLIRLATIVFSALLIIAILGILPNKNLGYCSTIGSRTLNIYFWHRIICFAFVQYGVYEVVGSNLLYTLIGFAMTAVLALPIFGHPANDIMSLGKKLLQSNNK